jgi:hypothetical protein
MKARVISTRRIVDVVETTRKKTIHDYFGAQNDIEIVVYYDGKKYYTQSELEFDVSSDPDYWTRLEYTYTGMAMHGILACDEWKISPRGGVSFAEEVALQAREIAHALVEKMKEESK